MFVLLVLFSQLTLADSLYSHGYYEEARIEYLRGFLFHPELKQKIEPRLRYAISLTKHDEAKGIEELNSVVNDFPDLAIEVRTEIARQYIQVNRNYLAITLLNDTEETELLGLAYLLDDQILSARNTFVKSGDYELAGKIDDHIRSQKKSEKTAVLLSLILPGAGQSYAGNPGQGFMDFTLNLGSAYLLYNALRQHKYVDACLVFFFLLNRFYLGSLHNAQQSAISHNQKLHQAWLNTILKDYFSTTPVD
jgi:hypothetical protein